MPTIIQDGKEKHVDGFISQILTSDGKIYALRSSIIAVKPITCPKCGGTVSLRYGEGKCDFCGVSYTTKFELVETSAIEESKGVDIHQNGGDLGDGKCSGSLVG